MSSMHLAFQLVHGVCVCCMGGERGRARGARGADSDTARSTRPWRWGLRATEFHGDGSGLISPPARAFFARADRGYRRARGGVIKMLSHI